MSAAVQEVAGLPDMKVSVRQQFGIDSDMEVPAYSQADEHVPEIDSGLSSSTGRPRSPFSPALRATAA